MASFNNLIKITSSKDCLNPNEVLRGSNSLDFIKLRSVKREDLPGFLKDLKAFVDKLDDATVHLYRTEEGGKLQKEYENLQQQLKQRQSRLSYLSSFFETITQKINATKNAIDDREKKLEEAENKKWKIDRNMKSLRYNLRSRRKHRRNEALTSPTNPFGQSESRPVSIFNRSKRFASTHVRSQHDVTLELDSVNPERIENISIMVNPINWDAIDEWVDDEDFFDDLN